MSFAKLLFNLLKHGFIEYNSYRNNVSHKDDFYFFLFFIFFCLLRPPFLIIFKISYPALPSPVRFVASHNGSPFAFCQAQHARSRIPLHTWRNIPSVWSWRGPWCWSAAGQFAMERRSRDSRAVRTKLVLLTCTYNLPCYHMKQRRECCEVFCVRCSSCHALGIGVCGLAGC